MEAGAKYAVSLAPPQGKPDAIVDVAVLLGGCGDCRHLFGFLLDCAQRTRDRQRGRGRTIRGTPPAQLRARMTLNDHHPEVIARVYLLLVFLERAAQLLPSDVAPKPSSLPAEAARMITAFWHVYCSATVPASVQKQLQEVMTETYKAEDCPLDFVRCTPGTWRRIQLVCQNWTTFDMSVADEQKKADFTRAMDEQMRSRGPPPQLQVHPARNRLHPRML